MYLEDIVRNTEIRKGAIIVQKSTGVWSKISETLADDKFETRLKNKDDFNFEGELTLVSLNTLIMDYQIAVS